MNTVATSPQPRLGAPAKRSFIRTAKFEDYDQIAAVEARHGLTVKPRDQWLDLWLDNPAYLELEDWPIGWVIEDGGGRIVGSLGNVPTFFYFGGKRYVSAAGRGWAVDVQHRALSVMLLAHQLKQRGADMNLITTPSQTTAALCRQLGWSPVPVGEWDRSALWITNHPKVVRSYLDSKIPKWISASITSLIAPPLLLRDSLRRRTKTLKSATHLDWSVTFDKRFDAFCSDLRQHNSNLMLGIRNSQTLHWHFKAALEQKRLWILTACMGSRLVGYAILERRDVHSLDLRRALFIDLQLLSKDDQLCTAMLDLILGRCRRERIHLLENVGCWVERSHFIRPPYHRRLEAWSYLYRITNPALERPLLLSESWYPTQYDGDASL